MSDHNKESSKTVNALELKVFNLFETLFSIIKIYLIFNYDKVYKLCKIGYVTNLINIFICNVKARLNNNTSQRKNLLEWIRTKVTEPYSPTNFNQDWRDGITLCALIEGVVPGSCPRYDLLNKYNPFENIELGLALINKNLNIDSLIESHEIHDCTEEAKLVYLLSRIKFESVKLLMKSVLSRSIVEVKDTSGNSHKMFESLFGDHKACFAKGMGLILGVRARRARFNIFCKPTQKLNLVIEISGPNKSICREKIEIFKPRKRISTDFVNTSLITGLLSKKKYSEENLRIPFFYEVFQNKIVVTYIPLIKGKHRLSIVWQGQHIMNSPYTVNVEENGADPNTPSEPIGPTSPTKFVPGLIYPISALDGRNSLSFDETATVVKRKVLRQVVLVNGQERVITDINSDTRNTLNSRKNSQQLNEIIMKDSENDRNLCNHEYSNQTNELFDIIETISNHSELSTTNTQNNIENNHNILHNKSEVIEKQDSITKKSNFDEINYTIDRKKIADNPSKKYTTYEFDNNNDNYHKHQVISKAIIYNNEKEMNNFNECRTYLPVKNLIETWETKLSNDIGLKDSSNLVKENNELNRIENTLRFNPVKNRCKIFEQKNIYNTNNFNIDNEKELVELISSDIHKDKKEDEFYDIPESDELIGIKSLNTIESKNNLSQSPTDRTVDNNSDETKSLISSMKKLSTDAVIDTPVSQPDSGISTNFFCNNKTKTFQNHNFSRQKSYSYPNLIDSTKIATFLDSLKTDQTFNTRTSSVTGQFIDDEIPDFSSLFLGEYVSYTGLINTERPMTFDDIKFNDLIDDDIDNSKNLPNPHIQIKDLGVYPDKCQVFGAGVYYGQVGIKNHFVVSTKDAGKSFLAVGVQGSEQEDVVEVTVTSIGERKYEIMYEVSQPGYFIIFVKWGDCNIADSPFICKVTY